MKTIILILVITICSCICTITNKDANSCINALTIPKKVEFAFTHGVACNQFHNNLVDVS
jgi:hypothetical protein